MTAITDLTDDGFFGGRVRLLQPKRGHRVGSDAALLAAAALGRMKPGDRVVDLGAGVGAVGLTLAASGASLSVLVEIDAATAALAQANAERNGLAEKARIVVGDVAHSGRLNSEAEPAGFDLAVANPPFDDEAAARPSPQPRRALAHVAEADLIEAWMRAAARLLKPSGSFLVIGRPGSVAETLAAAGRRFGDLRLRPLHPTAERPAVRLLIAGRKGRRGPLRLLPGLVLNGADGAPTPEADAVQRGLAPLPMD